MKKAIVLLLGIAGTAATGVVSGHYYLTSQTEKVYQIVLEEVNQQFSDNGLPIDAKEVSFDGETAYTQITLPEKLGGIELILKQVITAGPLLNTPGGVKSGLYAITTTLDKGNFPPEISEAFQLRDGADPFAINSIIDFDQTISTEGGMGPFVFQATDQTAPTFTSAGFHLTGSSNTDQSAGEIKINVGTIKASSPEDKGTMTIASLETHIEAGKILNSMVLEGRGDMKLGAVTLQAPDQNASIKEMLYSFNSVVQDGKIVRDDAIKVKGLTLDAAHSSETKIENWHVDMTTTTSGFSVEDLARLNAKNLEMNHLTSSMLENGSESLDEEQYKQVLTEYISAFVDTVKKDLSMAMTVNVGPENKMANLDASMSYVDERPMRKLETIGQLIEALKFDAKASVPMSLVENDPQTLAALQQFAMMGFAQATDQQITGHINLSQGKATLNGEDFPLDMWIAGLRNQPLRLTALQ